MFPHRKGNTFFWYGQYPSSFFLLCLGLGTHYPFLDIGPLACEAAEVVDSIPPHLPELVHLDFLDEGRRQGENTFYPYAARHLADCDHLHGLGAFYLDYNALVLLDSLFVPFANLVRHRDGIATLECRELFRLTREGLFGHFDQIYLCHCSYHLALPTWPAAAACSIAYRGAKLGLFSELANLHAIFLLQYAAFRAPKPLQGG